MQTIPVEDLDDGTVFDCSVYTGSGEKLADPFTFLREEQLSQLHDWGIETLQVESGPLSDEQLKAYRRKAREQQRAEKTTTEDIFKVEDPVAEGAVEPDDPLRESVKRRVKSSYEECLEETKNILQPLSQGRIEDAKTLYDIVQPIFEVAWNMQSALLYLLADLDGKDEEDYLFPYSLHTCLVSVLLAQEMGYDEAETRRVGVGGLIHDVGMFKIPQHIRLATGDLTDEQYQMIESHPERGARILSEVDRLESSVKRVVAEHHEQIDGSGYPLEIDHEDIHPHARIINLSMTYVAMTQNRSHRSSFSPQETIKELLEQERHRYDDRVLSAFLKRFGLYPPGTFARLNTGQLVLALESERTDPKNPVIKVLTTPNNDPLKRPFKVSLSNYDVSIDTVVDDTSLGGALELA
jgi:HD-GYP domain-containing protein (c-di-GMP phosphodiesterase class II)